MCLNPIYIKNPLYRADKVKGHVYSFGSSHQFYYSRQPKYDWYLHDCSYSLIPVPCRTCAQCVSRRQTDMIQRVEQEARTSWLYFVTLTYNNESLPILELGDYRLKYADIGDVQDMIKRLRIKNTFRHPFKYFIVSERGSLNGRPHFHCLLSFKKSDIGDVKAARSFGVQHKWDMLREWKRNIGDRNNVEYLNLTTYKESHWYGTIRRNYDFHFVEPSISTSGCSDVAFYVTSYMVTDFEQQRALKYALKVNDIPSSAWIKLRNKCVKSIRFGVTDESEKNVRSFIDISLDTGYPQYTFSNGKSVPLSRYYRDKYLSLDDKNRIYQFTHVETPDVLDSPIEDRLLTDTQYSNAIRLHLKHNRQIDEHSIIDFLTL